MKCFYAITEEGNISNASKRLNIAQPALSRQMKQLEEQLGVQLFERGSRRIKLTGAGQLLRERVEQILELVDGTVQEISELHSGDSGTIAIGTVTTSGALVLPPLIKKFHEQYPKVTFQLWEGDGFRILELLDKGIIEVGIIRAPFDSNVYESIVLPDEPLMIAMRREDDVNPGSSTVRLSELAEQPLIVPIRWKAMFTGWCEQAGFKPTIVCLCDGIIMNVLWAQMGIGMALVPKSTTGIITEASLVYKTIREPAVATQTVIVWLRNRSLSAGSKHFLELIRELHPE